eukprot:scaffold65495_cov36-Phaeocystis_antarctica.AAC.1
MPRCRGGAWTSSGPRAVTSRGSRHKDVFLGCVSLVKGVSGCLGFTSDSEIRSGACISESEM